MSRDPHARRSKPALRVPTAITLTMPISLHSGSFLPCRSSGPEDPFLSPLLAALQCNSVLLALCICIYHRQHLEFLATRLHTPTDLPTVELRTICMSRVCLLPRRFFGFLSLVQVRTIDQSYYCTLPSSGCQRTKELYIGFPPFKPKPSHIILT